MKLKSITKQRLKRNVTMFLNKSNLNSTGKLLDLSENGYVLGRIRGYKINEEDSNVNHYYINKIIKFGSNERVVLVPMSILKASGLKVSDLVSYDSSVNLSDLLPSKVLVVVDGFEVATAFYNLIKNTVEPGHEWFMYPKKMDAAPSLEYVFLNEMYGFEGNHFNFGELLMHNQDINSAKKLTGYSKFCNQLTLLKERVSPCNNQFADSLLEYLKLSADVSKSNGISYRTFFRSNINIAFHEFTTNYSITNMCESIFMLDATNRHLNSLISVFHMWTELGNNLRANGYRSIFKFTYRDNSKVKVALDAFIDQCATEALMANGIIKRYVFFYDKEVEIIKEVLKIAQSDEAEKMFEKLLELENNKASKAAIVSTTRNIVRKLFQKFLESRVHELKDEIATKEKKDEILRLKDLLTGYKKALRGSKNRYNKNKKAINKEIKDVRSSYKL